MKRYGLCGTLIAGTAALSTTAVAAGEHPWQLEASAFLPQEGAKDLIGTSMFHVAVLRDVKHVSDAWTSIGASFLHKTKAGGEITAGGVFARQTWFGSGGSPAVGGPFAGFQVGIFQSRVKTPDTITNGGNNGGSIIIPGTAESRIGVGAGIFVGYQLGERFSVKGGYEFYPEAASTAISGFTLTVGYRF